MRKDGARDLEHAAAALASRIPAALAPLARVAYNFAWSWAAGGREVFRDIDPHRWRLCGENPVRLLQEASPRALVRAADNRSLVERAEALADAVGGARPRAAPERPVAFFCAEFGVHRSLPIYSGGLGVLAGDFLKEASDRGVEMVGVGLLYRKGFFHQQLDASGRQHEYWIDIDPDRLPAAVVTDGDGNPLVVYVPVRGREVAAQVWRADVGRVPLYLLDTELPQNTPLERWIAARLYVGNPFVRLAQYLVLGVGGVRALRAIGIDPRVVHMNEGHAALAALELAAEEAAADASFDAALDRARSRVVFTTHTPVAAGNETYPPEQILEAMPDFPGRLGIDPERFLALGRVNPGDRGERPGMTPLAIRVSRSVNGVSRRHGGVSRRMWRPMFPGKSADDVPISHVTNGVHIPSWMAPPLRRLLTERFGPGWEARASDPGLWEKIDAVPDEALWAARCEARARLVDFVRLTSVTDRLTRGDALDYVEQASQAFDPNVLTIGFARRLAAYKRLHLIASDPGRAIRLLSGPRPVQFLFAGKAHPQDEEAKRIVQGMFALKASPEVARRVHFLEDYDLGIAGPLIAGCDVWVNLPRPPQEASGTSGMKAAMNGALNLSVLDGWWAEACDGENGWGIGGAEEADWAAQDARDAAAAYDLLEKEIAPLFYDRDADGVPRRWIARVKRSLKTLAPRFSATRMLDDYALGIYER